MATAKRFEAPKGRKWDGATLLVGPGLALLVLGELGSRISPEWVAVLAPFGITYGVGWTLTAAGVAWRLVSFRWLKVVLPLAVLVGTWPTLSLVFSLGAGSGQHAVEEGTAWGLVSFNVRRLDEFGWLEGDQTRSRLAAWFNDQSAEVWCLQEFPAGGEATLRKAGWDREGRKVLAWPKGAGPAVVTAFPVLGWEAWMFGPEAGKGRVVQADVKTPAGPVRVFNVHLQSLHFSKEDYAAVEEGPNREQGRRLFSLLTQAYKARAAQVEELRLHLAESPYPVVVAGDFNDSPVSYALRQLRKSGLHDSFEAAGFGVGSTHVGMVPGLRIDGVLGDSTLAFSAHRVHDVVLSDHRPVEVALGRRKTSPTDGQTTVEGTP